MLLDINRERWLCNDNSHCLIWFSAKHIDAIEKQNERKKESWAQGNDYVYLSIRIWYYNAILMKRNRRRKIKLYVRLQCIHFIFTSYLFSIFSKSIVLVAFGILFAASFGLDLALFDVSIRFWPFCVRMHVELYLQTKPYPCSDPHRCMRACVRACVCLCSLAFISLFYRRWWKRKISRQITDKIIIIWWLFASSPI